MEKKITYYDEEKYLFRTSSLLLIPSIIGLMSKNYNTSYINLVACTISSVFWYYPIKGARRTLDLYFQPIFGTYMYLLGMRNGMIKLPYMITGNLLLTNGLYLYYKSCTEYHKLNRFWYIYHGLFHISMSSACVCVHYAIKK